MQVPPQPSGTAPPAARWLTRGVLAIGLASFLSDISHEIVTLALPFFLAPMVVPAMLATVLGAMEGVADFLSSVAKLTAGHMGARLRRKKGATAAGYLVTALSNALIAIAGVWPQVFAGRVLGWSGRGFRGPLRDTLMAEQTHEQHFGKAYGFERALDSAGAVAGALAVVILWGMLDLRQLYWIAVLPGLAAAGFIVWGVREERLASHSATANGGGAEPPRDPPGEPGSAGAASREKLPREFRQFLVAVALFGLGDFSRTLMILWAIGEKPDPARPGSALWLYVIYNLVASGSSLISGRRSDTLGRKPLLVSGYATAAAVSLLMAFNVKTVAVMAAVFVGSGLYIGIQEALERAAAADLLPAPSRSFGFGLLATVNGVADLAASVTVGVLQNAVGPMVAFSCSSMLCLAGCVALLGVPLDRRPSRTRP